MSAAAPSTDAGKGREGPWPAASVQGLAWFGKLPVAGDFVSRHMPYAVREFWDQWCGDGMEALKAGSVSSGLGVWGRTPMWAFALPCQPGVPHAQLGVLAPSCDRVGRVFPFLVVVPLHPGQQELLLDHAPRLASGWSEVVAQAQEARTDIENLDARLRGVLMQSLDPMPAAPARDEEKSPQAARPEQDLDSTRPLDLDPLPHGWPLLSGRFDPNGAASYWWSVPPERTGFQSRTHNGPLRTVHFLDLCH